MQYSNFFLSEYLTLNGEEKYTIDLSLSRNSQTSAPGHNEDSHFRQGQLYFQKISPTLILGHVLYKDKSSCIIIISPTNFQS